MSLARPSLAGRALGRALVLGGFPDVRVVRAGTEHAPTPDVRERDVDRKRVVQHATCLRIGVDAPLHAQRPRPMRDRHAPSTLGRSR